MSLRISLALAALLSTAAARAQDVPLAAAYDRCTGLLRDARTAEAVECWRELRARTDHPSVRYGLANALRAAGRNREAIGEFRRFVAAAAGDASQAEFARRARAAMRDLEASLGSLALTTVPADARVFVDGVEETSRGEELALDPGVHVLVVQAPEYAPLTRRVHVSVGARERLHVALSPLTTVGRLAVEAEPAAAAIELDGSVAAHGSLDEAVGAGRHHLRVTAPGYSPFERDVDLAVGARVALRVSLDDVRPVTSRTWFRVAVGVGAAALVAGVAVGLTLALSHTEPRFDGALYNIPASP